MPPENVFCVFSSVEDCITWRNKAIVCYFSQSEAVWSTEMNFWNVCATFHQHVYLASFIIPEGPGKQRGLLLCVCRNETDVPRASRTAKVFGASRPVQEKETRSCLVKASASQRREGESIPRWLPPGAGVFYTAGWGWGGLLSWPRPAPKPSRWPYRESTAGKPCLTEAWGPTAPSPESGHGPSSVQTPGKGHDPFSQPPCFSWLSPGWSFEGRGSKSLPVMPGKGRKVFSGQLKDERNGFISN